jgi:hypothetical protein
MKAENLVFKFNPLEDPNALLEDYFCDINDGQCYKDSLKSYCLVPSKDVLCPLILFIDKTHTDAIGNHTLEPVSLCSEFSFKAQGTERKLVG